MHTKVRDLREREQASEWVSEWMSEGAGLRWLFPAQMVNLRQNLLILINWFLIHRRSVEKNWECQAPPGTYGRYVYGFDSVQIKNRSKIKDGIKTSSNFNAIG